MSKTATRLFVACLCPILLMAHREHSADAMSDAARQFLAALTPDQQQKAVIAFDSDERYNWHFVPRERKGLPLREMTPPQRHLAHALLSAGLSAAGYRKATTIMSLEDVLKLLENDSGERRNPEKYYFSVFGQPGDPKQWGFRVEGHHLSLNFAVVNGKIATSPTFLGANPAEVRQGPRKGLRVLHAEEDLARRLMEALSPEQRDAAIVSKTAYPDILTEASRQAALKGQPTGLQVTRLNAKQREMLMDLLAEYVHNVPSDLAEKREQQIKAAGNNLWFAWAGVPERGGPHYYRVQAPAFLVEYDNTQNNANHIHSVWRDLEGDFGNDLLKQHYERAKHDPAHGHNR